MTKHITRRVVALFLLITVLFSMGININAETISDGIAKTVTISMDERFSIMQTTDGVNLNGYAWSYKTDTGITGPAYCVNWGLKSPATNKKLTIAGKYTASPKTMGAFANGYPQRSLEEFIRINGEQYPVIKNLTKAEYASATQIAVWATMGTIAVSGTDFTSGRATLAEPVTTSQIRTKQAMEIILYNASFWDKALETGMHIRLARDEAGSVLNIEDSDGIFGAEHKGMYGIKKEVINGVEYFTRSFVASSATSTFRHDYFIELYPENAPEGTIFTDLNNKELETIVWENIKRWKMPTEYIEESNMNTNGEEYCGEFKICIPVRNTPENADIIIRGTSTAAQYGIYLANNTDDTEQSYIIADPRYTPINCMGELKWSKVTSPYGRLVLNKTDDMGNSLPGAIFKLTGTDGSTFEGTSNEDGVIIWEFLNPDIQYTLTETQAPKGFLKAEAMTVSVPAGQTKTLNVKNISQRKFTLRKIDAQNGNPLIGATFRFEQTDGSYKTDITTNHTGTIELEGGDLPFGSYKVYEIEAPAGYEKDTKTQAFKWDGAQDVGLMFENIRKNSLVVIKMDKETHEPLQDASFKVFKDGKLITTVTTDNAGYARISGLSEGYYEIQESVAPEGYILDEAKHGVHIDPYNPATEDDPVFVITNSRKPSLTIKKWAVIAALLDKKYEYPDVDFRHAWDYLLFNDEHSYGTSGYQGRRVYETWMQHRDWIEKAKYIAETEKDNALKIISQNISSDKKKMVIFNPTALKRRELIYSELGDKYVFADIPAFGYKTINEAEFTTCERSIEVTDIPPIIENKYYKIVFSENGSLRSIYDKELKRELLDNGTYCANELVYTNDNHKTYFTPSKANFKVIKEQECTTVLVRTEEKHLKTEIEIVIKLVNYEKRIDIDNKLHHVKDMINKNRYNRYIYYAFPFAVEKCKRYCHLNGSMAEYAKSVTGHCTDVYMAVNEWCCSENNEFGVALMMLDSQLVEYDHIHPDKTDFGNPGDGSQMYVYAANDWLQMYTPGGSHLEYRFRYSITSYMERIGDQASDIAEIAEYAYGSGMQSEIHIADMARATIRMVTDSIESFVKKDTELAYTVIEHDNIVDDLFDKVRSELISAIESKTANAEALIDLIMIAKYFERIGDHAENIAEWVIYSITGKHAKDDK